jgi:hypothetical protein
MFFSKLHQMWNGKSIWAAPVTRKLQVDASDSGWAARAHNGSDAHGHWDHYSRGLHIMTRECLAVYYGLRSFVELYSGQVVDVVCDNMAVVYGLSCFSSRLRQLMRVVGLICWLCHRQNITLAPRYIPSVDNVVDALSRRTMAGEWQISDWLFDWIQNQWGPHDVDRFASHACHVLPRYNSAFWDPLIEAVDGLAQDWRGANNLATRLPPCCFKWFKNYGVQGT